MIDEVFDTDDYSDDENRDKLNAAYDKAKNNEVRPFTKEEIEKLTTKKNPDEKNN